MRFLPLSAALLALLACPVRAAKWDVVPALSVKQTYTDNVSLASDALARSEWVTQLIPAISIRGTGADLEFSVNYAPEITYYAEGTDDDTVFQRGNASLNAELADNFLFLDLGATADQYNVSLQGPLTGNNINTTGNISTVGTFFVTPYILHDFGSVAQADVRFTYSAWDSDKEPQRNNTSNRIDLRLASGPALRQLSWDLDYRREDVYYDDLLQTDRHTEITAARVRQLISPTIGLLATGGYEYYRTGEFRPESSGPVWGGGIDWAPSPRTSLTAIVGRRFFGNAYDVDFRHSARRMVFTAGYAQEVTDTRSQFFVPATNSTADYLDQLYSSSIADPAARQQAVDSAMAKLGIPPSLNAPVNYFTNQLFLLRGWRATVAVQGASNVIIANVFQNLRNGLLGDVLLPGIGNADNNTNQSGTSISWNWSMSARDAWNLIAEYTSIRFPGTGRDDDLTGLGLNLTRQFQPRLFGALGYRWQQNISTQTSSSFRENAVYATLTMGF